MFIFMTSDERAWKGVDHEKRRGDGTQRKRTHRSHDAVAGGTGCYTSVRLKVKKGCCVEFG